MAKEKIILIDDEDKLRRLLARILGMESYQIYQVANAHRGLAMLEQVNMQRPYS